MAWAHGGDSCLLLAEAGPWARARQAFAASDELVAAALRDARGASAERPAPAIACPLRPLLMLGLESSRLSSSSLSPSRTASTLAGMQQRPAHEISEI
ncbi:hypothetical protein EJB05_55691 [Eragrostis curvula]|uniref:Uncharacterized protein n=1 Tax=Eragrostis curvula TaxID=38414 RepID=A0A5J9SJ22_9POAL|nr:hypothetical protein EJB05_55691 [Eragrostis curvula]